MLIERGKKWKWNSPVRFGIFIAFIENCNKCNACFSISNFVLSISPLFIYYIIFIFANLNFLY